MKLLEEKYRSFVENLPDAFAYHQIVTDHCGNPRDYITLDVNSAYETMTGLEKRNIVGKKATEALPGIRHSSFDWIGAYGKVALTGEAVSFENYFEPLGRWLKVNAYSHEIGYFITVFQDISMRKNIAMSLRKSEERLRLLARNLRDIIVETDTNGLYSYISPSHLHVLGRGQELIGRRYFDFIHPEDHDRVMRAFQQIVATGESEKVEYRYLHSDKQYLWLESFGNTYTNIFNDTVVLFTNRDITRRKEAEIKLTESESKFRSLVSRMYQGLAVHEMIYDEAGKPVNYRFIDVNEGFEQHTGLKKEDIIGQTVLDVLPDTEDYWIEKYGNVAATGEPLQFENYSQELDRYYHVVAYRNRPGQFAVILTDITMRKQAEEKTHYMSFHDKLTGLYNRSYMEEEMTRLDTERQLPISIIMADLNGLKLVNDTYGHSKGDEMLRHTVDILRKSCRAEDIIARWGGDEFVILLPQTLEKDAKSLCRRIQNRCLKAYVKDVPVSIALGVGSKTTMEENLEEALKKAENNMYEQKLTESRSEKSGLINALLKTLAEKSYETEAHTRRMQKMALKIGEQMNFSDQELSRLSLLTTMHDIGKISIPEEILTKEKALTEDEWEIIKKHPETGYRIARATSGFAQVAEDILYHHERWDGLGYPRGLKGEEIPLLARITAIADAYEVMLHGRPYKKPIPLNAVVAEFKRCAGSQFDPNLVGTFLQLLEQEVDNRLH